MAATKTITANGSKGHHKFALRVSEDTTSGNSSFMGYSFTLSPIQTGWDWNWSGQPNRISFSVRIGDKTFNGNIPIYDGRSTVVVASNYDIEIPHNDDGSKTIDISFTVTDNTGANYTCGNASASGTLQLTQLHQPPEITDATLVENNTVLTNLQVPNNTIVQYLSNKTLTVTAVYDDSEIDTCSVYHNNVLIGTSNTNEVPLNFANVGELITTETNGTHYVGLNVAVKDKKNGYSTRMFNFPAIKYTRPTYESTSTNIRRKTTGGVALTKNIVVLNFVGTCYKGNDVIGNANKPTVKYKIWNGTEPDYSELTVSNTANVVVKDFEIHDIEYTKTYQYKIKINDVFTNSTDNPIEKVDKVPTGVSVWTEYKDRVDFLKITQGGIPVATFINIEKEKEIATNEFLNGKRIYARLYTGNMPSISTTSTVLQYLNFEFTEAWIDQSLSYITKESETLPTTFYYSSSDYLRTWINKGSNGKHIRIRQGLDLSIYTFNIVVKYIKD